MENEINVSGYLENSKRLRDLKSRAADLKITVAEQKSLLDDIQFINSQILGFGRRLILFLEDFMHWNKELYKGIYSPKTSLRIISVEFKKKKDAFVVIGYYQYSDDQSDNIAYLIPMQMITAPEEYKRTRVEYLRVLAIEKKKESIIYQRNYIEQCKRNITSSEEKIKLLEIELGKDLI